MEIPPDLRPAYRACEKMAFSHYENFPVASLLLPSYVRPHIAALYAFARTADDFADEPGHEGKRIPLINGWEKKFKAALKGEKSDPILSAFAQTVRTFDVPLQWPLDLLRAFRMDAMGHRWSTWNSLLYYCRHSADPVGRMVLWISGIRDPRNLRYSDFICSGLQLINFWQDTSLDLARGRVYYPQQALKKAGVREKDLLEGKDSPAVRTLVKNAVDLTEIHFRKGLPLLDSVRGRLRPELKATFLGGQAILNKVRALDYNVLRTRPRLSVMDKVRIASQALLS